MRAKKFTLSLFSTLIILLTLSVCIYIEPVNNVHAQTTYNWVLNDGFEDYLGEEQIANGDFENGLNDGWSQYGGTLTVSTTYQNSPTTSIYIATSPTLRYNFTDSLNVASVSSITFYALPYNWQTIFLLKVYYSDDTHTDVTYNADTLQLTDFIVEGEANGWNYLSYGVGNFSEGKSIVMLEFDTTAQWVCIDDVSVKTYAVGQEDITSSTLPWYNPLVASAHNVINSSQYRTGSYSLKLTERMLYYQENVQDFDYLPTDTVSEISYYVKTDSTTARRVYCKLTFGDGSQKTEYQNIVSASGWTKLTWFDDAYALPTGKFITKLSIYSYTSISSGDVETYVDDVSILSTLPVGQSSIFWYVMPSADNYIENSDDAYSYGLVFYGKMAVVKYGVLYRFYGEIFDDTGLKTENGTYQVFSNEPFVKSGSIINGEFEFQMDARVNTDDTNRTEAVLINIDLDDRSFSFTAYFYWVYLTQPVPSITPTPSDNGLPSLNEDYNRFMSYVGILIVVLAPAFILAVPLKMGSWGAFIGLNIGVILAYTFFSQTLTVVPVVMFGILDIAVLFKGRIGG